MNMDNHLFRTILKRNSAMGFVPNVRKSCTQKFSEVMNSYLSFRDQS
jgi:hypothetical protein